jgi:hypothetical protein
MNLNVTRMKTKITSLKSLVMTLGLLLTGVLAFGQRSAYAILPVL